MLAAVFLAWWLPQDMGCPGAWCVQRRRGDVRGAGGLASRRLPSRASRSLLAGLGFAAHPTGFTLLAPLLARAAKLWRLGAVPGAATQ
jgi:hypothetical protein